MVEKRIGRTGRKWFLLSTVLPMSSALPLFKILLCKKGSDNTYLFNTGKHDKPDSCIHTFLVYAFPFIPPIEPLVQTEIRISIYEILGS